MVGKYKLIIPTLCVGMQLEPLCGSGRWRVTAIKLRKKLPLLLERVGVRRIKIRKKPYLIPSS